jgi:hypothetical protein
MRTMAVCLALVALLPQGPRAKRWEELWQRSGPGGRVSVRDYPGNGGRPVAVHLPENFDASRPVRLVTYFHGHDGDIGDRFVSGGVMARLRWLGSTEPDTVFVCVEAAAKPFHYWMAAPRESYASLSRDALAEAARLAGAPLTVRERIVSAHSGGGLALRNAVTSGHLTADRLEFLDSNYGDWGMVIARWAAPRGVPITTWNTPGATRVNDEAIRAAFPAIVTVNHSPVGHHQIPGKLLGATLID